MTAPKDAPKVAIQRLFDGLQDLNVGNGNIVQPGPQRFELLRMHGRDDMPTSISLTMGYEVLAEENDVVAFDVAPFVTLKWGVGGASFTAELDLLSGQIINITCTSLELAVTNPIRTETSVNLPGTPIQVSAAIGVGGTSRPFSNPARRTIRVGTLAQNASVIVPIPNFAVSYNVFTPSNPPALQNIRTMQLAGISNPGAVPLSQTFSPTFDMAGSTVPIIGGARGLFITNTAAADATLIRVMFTLSL